MIPNKSNPVGPLLNVVTITKTVNTRRCKFLKFLLSTIPNRILRDATRNTQAANCESEPVLMSGTLNPSEISKDG